MLAWIRYLPGRIVAAAVITACVPALGDGQAASANQAETGSPTASATPAEPTIKVSPTTLLKQFEPPAGEEYTLGSGDDIAIDFPSRPELSTKGLVGPDGLVTVPLIGAVKVAGLTRDGASKEIADKMSKYYKDIDATVRIEKYGANNVTVLGDVKAPGTYNFEQTPTLLAVLSRGGIERRTDGSLPEQCVVYRGDQVVWVDLQDLVTTGSPLADLRLRRNDIVFVPALSLRTVTVMGQVQHPGAVPLKHDSTLVSVMGEAGGLTDAAGQNPEIQIVHRSKGNRIQYVRFKDLLKPTFEASLYPGDVVYVPKSGVSKVGYFMQQIAPFMTMGSFAAIASH